MYKQYVVDKYLAKHPYPFRSATEVESLEDDRNCDVMVHVQTTPHLISVDTRVDIVSAYSKTRLKRLGIPTGRFEVIAGEIIESLAASGPLYAQIIADREASKHRQNEPAVAATGISKEELSKIVQAAVQSTVQQAQPTPTQAESDADKPAYRNREDASRYALIVGAEKYADLPEARYAERDAQSMRSHLVALGYPSRNIVLLTGSKATRAGLAKNLENWLARNTDEKSTVFFYYSGHGAPNVKTGQAYLVPIDGDPQYLEETAYPVKRVYEQLGALKARTVLVMLDACFSGAGGRSVLPKGTRPLVNKVDLGFPGQGGRIVSLTASDSDQVSGTIEEQRHGLFTYYVLTGLNGAAKDNHGQVTVDSLYRYLAPRVADEAHRQNRDQTPKLLATGQLERDDLILR